MRIVIAGGGGAGLLTSLVLARAGHEVVVVEQDDLTPTATVDEAAERAWRPHVPHVVQPHVFLPLFRLLLRDELPDVYAGLLDAGVTEGDTAAQGMPEVADDDLTFLLARRSTVDHVLRRVVADEPGVTVLDRTTVRGALGDDGDPPRVTGLATDGGPQHGDVVVDAGGRRSRVGRWLADLGAGPRAVVEAECGVSYYTRHYRLVAEPPGPVNNRVVLPLEGITAGVWGADNGTVVLGICPLAEDHRFRGLRHAEVFTAVGRTVPLLDAWLDALEPDGDVLAMGGLRNTMRRLVVDGRPRALGLHAVGDSVATTNPTFARGLGIALRGAVDLRAVLARHAGDPVAAALAADAAIGAHVEPFFRDQAAADSGRLAALRATLLGTPAPTGGTDPDRVSFGELASVAPGDPVLFHALGRLKGMLRDPEEVYADPEVIARVRSASPAARPRGPSLDELFAALGADARAAS